MTVCKSVVCGRRRRRHEKRNVRQTVEGAADRSAAEVCGALMSRLADTREDDDAALLVVRARELANDPRPAVARQVPVSDPAKSVSS